MKVEVVCDGLEKEWILIDLQGEMEVGEVVADGNERMRGEVLQKRKWRRNGVTIGTFSASEDKV